MIRPEPAADDKPRALICRQELYPLNGSSPCRGSGSRDRFPLAGV